MAFKLIMQNHTANDFTKLYKYLLDKYSDNDLCPAILLVDSKESMICQSNIYGVEVVMLDRNADNIMIDLKKIIRKAPENMSYENEKKLYPVWEPCVNYTVMYREAFNICQYLDIEMPALFFYREKCNPYFNTSVASQSEKSGWLVTDVFVKIEKTGDNLGAIKSLIHELRHAWQHKYHNNWFDSYKTYNGKNPKSKQNEEYSLQKTEIDADAFAYWLLEKNGIKYSFDDQVDMDRLLKERMRDIDNEWKDPIKLNSFKKIETNPKLDITHITY